jgi:hypothetical protein
MSGCYGTPSFGNLIFRRAGKWRDICDLDPETFQVILGAVLRQVRPPSPLAGRLSAQSLLFALGLGGLTRFGVSIE